MILTTQSVGFLDRILEKVATVDVRSLTAAAEDPLPSSTKKTKAAMIHPEMQQASEQMTPAKWKQLAKDVPVAVVAGGLGYGIGRTLAEVIGNRVAQTGQRPSWLKGVPAATAALGLAGAYAGSRVRQGMRARREAAE